MPTNRASGRSRAAGAALLSLTVWTTMTLTTAPHAEALESGHPRLIVTADQYPELRTRARNQPWRGIRDVVKSCTDLTYEADGNYYEKLASMRRLMHQGALACILFPENRDAYVRHLVEQMDHWRDINQARLTRPRGDWTSMITGGDAFFTSVLALDIIHDDLSDQERDRIEARLRVWYEFERDQSQGSWHLAKYGAMGLWALYLGDEDLVEEYAAAYDRRLRDHFTADGIALVGGNYASARLAAGELAKTYFMDVLTFVGWRDYYSDPLLGAFYEWFYGGMVTPTRHYAVFQDCRDTEHSGTGRSIGNYRAYRFSRRAAASAAWLRPAPLAPGLLGYVLVEEPLPSPVAPTSQLWQGGYATFWEDDPHEQSVMGALWAPDDRFSHDHFEVNALHVTGYGKTLIRNSGYEGWGRPVPGFSWHYVSRFDIRPEWDYAVSGNIAYLDRDEPHLSKGGQGLEEGLLHPALDYAAGHSGQAVKGGVHRRSMVFVKDRTDGATPYFVVFDEMARTDTSRHPLRVALHPASLRHEVIQEREAYRWAFDDDVFLTLFLATPADPGTRLKRGGLSQLDAAPMYLHSEYAYTGAVQQVATVLYPHQGVASPPAMGRIAANNYTGVRIDHRPNLVDVAVESTGEGSIVWESVELEARAALLRLRDGEVDFFFLRRARRFAAAGALGIEAEAEISTIIRGAGGRILSPGTAVTFTVADDEAVVHLDGVPAQVISRAAGRVTVDVPPGTHELSVLAP